MHMSKLSHKKISQKIYSIRESRVMFDSDLAELYEVETGALNRAVQRNPIRFPPDFMFQLTQKEHDNLKCQIGISSYHGGRRKLPFVFTEQGVAMLSSVLKGEKASGVNVEIIRSFVKLREFLLSNEALAQKLELLEKKYDVQFQAVFAAIREIMNPTNMRTKKISIADTDSQ